MQETIARHPLLVPVAGTALALAAIAALVFALMGWATQGAEMFRAFLGRPFLVPVAAVLLQFAAGHDLFKPLRKPGVRTIWSDPA